MVVLEKTLPLFFNYELIKKKAKPVVTSFNDAMNV